MTVREDLKRYLAGGVNSPVRSFNHLQREPLIVESGKGAHIVDIEGQSYIDYCCSWGALIHGHAAESIVSAATTFLQKGSSFGITTAIEAALAKKVHTLMPSLQQMRFVCSGTEATMTAVRLARGYTGRDNIIKFIGHYHGHADFFLVQAGSGVKNLHRSSSAGIPEAIVQHTLCLPFNDEEALQDAFRTHAIAAVIMEPVAGNMGVVPATQEFVALARKLTEETGALLIFDEVITGFRVAKGGAAAYYGITPDLTTLGKIVGGGFPVACVGGPREIMRCLAPEGQVYQAGTLAGNPIAMAAGLACLDRLDQEGFYEELALKSRFLLDPIKKALHGKDAYVTHIDSLFTLFIGEHRFTHFFNTLLASGIYFSPAHNEASFISAAHSYDDLEKTREVILRYVRDNL